MEGSVYIIKCKCNGIYVGSTERNLRRRQGEHQSECFNPKRKSYYSPAYKHFRNCGMTRDDLICQPIMEAEQDLRYEEAKWIKLLGNLNTNSSVEDLEKKEARRKRWRDKGKIIHKCPCGGTWSYTHKPRHLKTKKHQDWLEEEYQKKIKYINSNIEDASKEEKTQIKHIVLSYDSQNKKFLKEGE